MSVDHGVWMVKSSISERPRRRMRLERRLSRKRERGSQEGSRLFLETVSDCLGAESAGSGRARVWRHLDCWA